MENIDFEHLQLQYWTEGLQKGRLAWSLMFPQQEKETHTAWRRRCHNIRNRYARYCNPEKVKEIVRVSSLKNLHNFRQRDRAKYLWRGAKDRAQKKKQEFTLTVEHIQKAIEKGICEALDIPFELKDFRSPYMPSIERKNNSKGYSNENCIVVCWFFNQWKQHYSIDELLEKVNIIHQHKKNIKQIYQ
jgi:hypothetical protein